jgi:hypothetical protein
MAKKKKKFKVRLISRFPQHENYVRHWKQPGTSGRKMFVAAMIRYGIKGYMLGRLIKGVPVDFLFDKQGIALRVGAPFSDFQISEIEYMKFKAISVTPEPDVDWLQAFATILNVSLKDLKPMRPDSFLHMEEVEHRLLKLLCKDPNNVVFSDSIFIRELGDNYAVN